jgi:hypothetical protein
MLPQDVDGEDKSEGAQASGFVTSTLLDVIGMLA